MVHMAFAWMDTLCWTKSIRFFGIDFTVNTFKNWPSNFLVFLSMIHQCTIWKKQNKNSLSSLRQSGVKLRLCFQVQMISDT